MANAGAIDTILWPGCKAEVGTDLLNGGSYANKTGYHNTRNNLRRDHPNDYSIQLPIDRLGPGDRGSAQDLTFKSAQGGDFRNIAKYSRRLFEAGVNKDPRAYPMREFQGNIDSDRTVEGWSYYRGHAITTSDTSHLWHIHISVHRKYINDEAAMRSILSIWSGKEEEEDMPLTNDDIDRIWDRVTVENVWGVGDKPKVQADSALRLIGRDARDAKEGLAEVQAQLAEILKRLPAPANLDDSEGIE